MLSSRGEHMQMNTFQRRPTKETIPGTHTQTLASTQTHDAASFEMQILTILYENES